MDLKEIKNLIKSGKKNIKEIAGEFYGPVSKSAQVGTYRDLTGADDSVLKKVCDAINKIKK